MAVQPQASQRKTPLARRKYYWPKILSETMLMKNTFPFHSQPRFRGFSQVKIVTVLRCRRHYSDFFCVDQKVL